MELQSIGLFRIYKLEYPWSPKMGVRRSTYLTYTSGGGWRCCMFIASYRQSDGRLLYWSQHWGRSGNSVVTHVDHNTDVNMRPWRWSVIATESPAMWALWTMHTKVYRYESQTPHLFLICCYYGMYLFEEFALLQDMAASFTFSTSSHGLQVFSLVHC